MVNIPVLSAMSDTVQSYENMWGTAGLVAIAFLLLFTTIFVIVQWKKARFLYNLLAGGGIGALLSLVVFICFALFLEISITNSLTNAAEEHISENVDVESVTVSGFTMYYDEYYFTADLMFFNGDVNGLTVEMYYDAEHDLLRPLENSTIEDIPLTEDSALAPLIEGAA